MVNDSQSNEQAIQAGVQLDSKTRWVIFWLLIICSLAVVCSRIWQVEAVANGKEVPFLSANDRSRWITIRSLGDHNTYSIDTVLAESDGKSWDTIDKVMHWGRDFRPHFYSSKPPFLSTVLTYPYLAIKKVTGWDLKNEPFQVVRWMLLICQVIPLFFFLWAVGRTTELVAQTEWARMFIMGVAAFGTFVTTFAISLNNHLPAVTCVAVGLYALILIWKRESQSAGWFFLCGLMASIAAACELPALAFLVVALVFCMLRSVSKTVLAFLPPVALIVTSFFVTNHTAHNDWRPAYSHRSDGPMLTIIDRVDWDMVKAGVFSPDLQEALMAVRADLDENSFNDVQVIPGGWPAKGDNSGSRWITYFDEKTLPLVLVERTDGFGVAVHEWDNWYEYPGSYWIRKGGEGSDEKARSIVDRGEKDWYRYLFHLTIGHHGAFSLTPVWILSIFGFVGLCCSSRYKLRLLGLALLATTLVVIAFYVTRSVEDRNYGGWCCGPRWLFWLIPFWLVAMAPALDSMSESRGLRAIALLMLIISIGASFYAWANPWVHPWIYQWLVA